MENEFAVLKIFFLLKSILGMSDQPVHYSINEHWEMKERKK